MRPTTAAPRPPAAAAREPPSSARLLSHARWRLCRFDVTGFPTVKVFTNGEASDYQGERTAGAPTPPRQLPTPKPACRARRAPLTCCVRSRCADAIVSHMRKLADPDYVPPPAALDAG